MCTATRVWPLEAECMGKLLGCDSFDDGECRRDCVNMELIVSKGKKLTSILSDIQELAF